jgi:hypothetical protein
MHDDDDPAFIAVAERLSSFFAKALGATAGAR